MEREALLARLDPNRDPWDIAVIGGGAVGLGAALDAAARGHRCVLLEQHDFCKGTSSRSTKLIHGGVRYLAQGNVSLVREALHERELLFENAPDLVHPLRFVIPCYSFWDRWFYWTGMKCYDGLAGRLGIRSSRALDSRETHRAVPGLRTLGVKGAVAYYDAQFDDARLAIALAKTCLQLGATPLNYARVKDLVKQRERIVGLTFEDVETQRSYQLSAKVVVNATGAFSDEIRRMESPQAPAMISASQGVHLVVDQRFLGGEDAIMIPKTKDGRVLFAIPWLGRCLLGTTDTPVERASLEPRALQLEVDYLLEHFAEYLDPAPSREDVRSVFAGLRPLVRPQHEAGATSKISREHRILQSAGGLLSILGGKWTTFRKMSEEVIDAAEEVGGLEHVSPQTRQLKLLAGLGSDPHYPDVGPTEEQVQQLVDQEFARTVEDVLARRFRCLLLDARGSLEYAPATAERLRHRLGRSSDWAASQVAAYSQLAGEYLLG